VDRPGAGLTNYPPYLAIASGTTRGTRSSLYVGQNVGNVRPIGAAVVVAVLVGVGALTTSAVGVSATLSGTRQSVVRPVTSRGLPARGFAIRAPREPAVYCSINEASFVAVNKNIDACAHDSDNPVACWKSAFPHHVLCYDNPGTITFARSGCAEGSLRPCHVNGRCR
jgi:hypothetical protein